MMKAVLLAVLFFALVPGVLVSLPSPSSSLMTKAAVHAVVFALVWCLARKMLRQ